MHLIYVWQNKDLTLIMITKQKKYKTERSKTFTPSYTRLMGEPTSNFEVSALIKDDSALGVILSG